MSRVLVTGGDGFIGRHAVAALHRRRHNVLAPSRTDLDLLEDDPAPWLADNRPEALLHLAWYAVPGRYWTAPENQHWVEASLRLLDGFSAAGGRRAVLAGTSAEYDWAAGAAVLDEEGGPLGAATPYGQAKQRLHEAARERVSTLGISLAWGRIFFLFGPGEPAPRLVPSVARALLAGLPAETTHGEQVRDVIYVEDLADAFAALLESSVEGPVNLASGTGMSLRALAERTAVEVGRPDLLRVGALCAREHEPARLVASVRRLRDEVGWRPEIGLDEGLRRSCAAWRGSADGSQ